MMKNYQKSNSMLLNFKLIHELKKLRAEVHEHRYYLDKNVARRTEYLSLRIGVLESCNKTLCGKLASTRKELIQLQSSPSESQESPQGL